MLFHCKYVFLSYIHCPRLDSILSSLLITYKDQRIRQQYACGGNTEHMPEMNSPSPQSALLTFPHLHIRMSLPEIMIKWWKMIIIIGSKLKCWFLFRTLHALIRMIGEYCLRCVRLCAFCPYVLLQNLT